MPYLLGIDIGTSGTKSLVIDDGGRVLGEAYREYSIQCPHVGWAEQEPELWWQATCETVREALAKSRLASSEIAAAGLSGQMHGTVMLDASLQPLGNAIIWADSRSGDEVAELRERIGREWLALLTANPLATGFMAASLAWVRKHQPDRLAQVRHVLLPKDYVRLRLTGLIGSESSDASSTLLFDVANDRWSADMAELVGIGRSILPPVSHSCDIAGPVSADAAECTGLAAGTPVIFGGGDLAMNAVGNGVVRPGIACANIGTGGQLYVTSDHPTHDPQLRIHTFSHVMPGHWILSGAVLSAGLSLKWFRDNVAGFASYDEATSLAAQVKPGCDGLIFLPYLIGERTPHMDPNARGVFFGLALKHDRAAMARAIMEGVTFALRDALQIMRDLGIEFRAIIASGGGARSTLWKQIQADVFNVPVRTVLTKEQAALGAAICAGVGVNVYPGVAEACGRLVRFGEEVVAPIARNTARYESLFSIYQSIYVNNKEIFRKLDS
ncbi:MAG TPA: xylulokinase [Planctomycetota bacterium]|nr:xylulokinase [Planctomycetota bacterium]